MTRHLFYSVIASLTFFTRLPLWRWVEVPRTYYERVVPWWPLTGWVTGGTMAVVYAASQALHLSVGLGIVMALAARILLTGALHEDGWADFADGFGGGTTRERTLSIMKDSHIGTYGVLALILYFLLMHQTLHNLLLELDIWRFHELHLAEDTPALEDLSSPYRLLGLWAVVDACAKWWSSLLIYRLPYARKESEAKNQLVYAQVSGTQRLVSLALAALPALVFLWLNGWEWLGGLLWANLAAAVTLVLLIRWMRRRLGGYTGDCCGATFLLTEWIMYLALLLWMTNGSI